jgi:hypothetical protein
MNYEMGECGFVPNDVAYVALGRGGHSEECGYVLKE